MQRRSRASEPEIEFGFDLERRLLVLGLLAFGDGFAELARMLAVESLFERDRKRRFLRVADEHAEPRDGLQDGPMPTDCYDEQKRN
jgi:hypothetical protein